MEVSRDGWFIGRLCMFISPDVLGGFILPQCPRFLIILGSVLVRGVAELATLLRRGVLKGSVLFASRSPEQIVTLTVSPLPCCCTRGHLGFPSLALNLCVSESHSQGLHTSVGSSLGSSLLCVGLVVSYS